MGTRYFGCEIYENEDNSLEIPINAQDAHPTTGIPLIALHVPDDSGNGHIKKQKFCYEFGHDGHVK